GKDTGIIKTADLSNYCFYKLGQDADPDIGFSSRTGGASCTTTIPSDIKTLNNPQFVWLAAGTCKDDKSCAQTPTPSQQLADHMGETLKNNPNVSALMRERLKTDQAMKSADALAQNPRTLSLDQLGQAKSVL